MAKRREIGHKMPRYWEHPTYKRLSGEVHREIVAECKRIEPRADKQGACWNYLHKKRKPKLLRDFKKAVGLSGTRKRK